jgi:hypothetical protein
VWHFHRQDMEDVEAAARNLKRDLAVVQNQGDRFVVSRVQYKLGISVAAEIRWLDFGYSHFFVLY